MNLFIVSGEASGDSHGGHLVRALKMANSSLRFQGVGGDAMKSAGVELVHNIRDLSCAGLVEVLGSLPKLSSIFRQLKKHLSQNRPNALILIDFPDFNLRLARAAKALGIPVIYYVSPQVWAWRSNRVNSIAKCVDLMLVLFDFEKEIYLATGLKTEFVGHPLQDVLAGKNLSRENCRKALGLGMDEILVGFLPGSRNKEFKRLYPVMKEASKILLKQNPNLKFAVSVAPTIDLEVHGTGYDPKARTYWCSGQSLEIAASADCCVVASGTATLETACIGTPLIIVYKINPLTFHILKNLVKIKKIGLVNIVLGVDAAPELLQDECNPKRLAGELQTMLYPDELRRRRDILAALPEKLGGPGASRRAARKILEFLEDGK